MNRMIQIRNYDLPKAPRVCDVLVNELGQIIRFEMQNIKGKVFVDSKEMERQIQNTLKSVQK